MAAAAAAVLAPTPTHPFQCPLATDAELAGVADLRPVKSGLLSREKATRANRDMERFVAGMPKAELHLHIEGTLEPALAFAIAKRNGIDLGDDTEEHAISRRAKFPYLVPFLMEDSSSAAVLRTERDFEEACWTYLERASENNIRHVEMFFDPGPPCNTVSNMGLCFCTYYQVPLDQHANYRFGPDTTWLVVADLDDLFVPLGQVSVL